MKNYLKHTKKLVLTVLTVVMMVATSMVVLAAETNKAPDPQNLTVLTVGTQNVNKDGSLKFDTNGNKSIKKVNPTLYTNGSEFEVTLPGTGDNEALVELPNSITLDVEASIKIDKNEDGKINSSDKGENSHIAGKYTVKSSNESVATVEQSADGETITVYAGDMTGTATIKLTEKYPVNPKKPKTVTFKVTVKALVDEINFNSNVATVDGVKTVEMGTKGTIDMGTSVNSDASKKTVKYVVDKAYSKYIKVSSKGVITASKSTADLEGGYAEVRVVAQDQNYTYTVTSKGKTTAKKAVWGANEVIRVYVNDPEVQSVKILNVEPTVDKKGVTTEEKYLDGKATQAFATLNLKTNASSSAHTFKLQATAYAEKLWKGEVRYDALTYTTSNAKVATVDPNGVITAVANGTAKITVVPKDGVKLAGKEAVTLTVKVTTDIENITVASTDVTAFTGAVYTQKASVNAGISASADKKLTYEIVSATSDADPSTYVVKKVQYDTFAEYVAALSGKSLASGKIRSDVEGTVVYKVSSVTNPSIYREITINFINPVTSIKATVPSYNANGVASAKTSTTLYLDRAAEVANVTADDTCEITLAVAKKFVEGTSSDTKGITATSSNTAVAEVEEVNGKFVVSAKEKGKAVITLAATDGSKKTAKVTINVQQKVNDINVANSGDGEIYVVLNDKTDKNGVNLKTTAKFTATANADANVKGLAYSFESVLGDDWFAGVGDGSVVNGVTFKTQTLTISNIATTELVNYLGSTSAPEDGRILVGTLKVTAKDNTKDVVTDLAAKHIAAVEEVKVYAVAGNTYMAQEELEAAVLDITGGTGLTLYKGEKVDLASELEIPAKVTVRTVKWAVNAKADKSYIAVTSKGVLSTKKVTNLGEGAVLTVSMTGSAGDVSVDIPVRVVAAQKDFDKELSTQITAVLKDNTYTWLGAKPTYNAGKSTLTLAISDITMSKEAADAEMREKLTSVVKVLKNAAEIAIDGTATSYSSITVSDPYTKMVWSLDRVGADVVVSQNGEVVGTYGFTEVDAAISGLVDLITTDIDDIVEWGNKTLNVTLVADNTAAGYAPFTYVTNYKVVVTVKDADVEDFLDAKIGKTVDNFNEANAEKKAETGIESVRYDAKTNVTTVDVFNGDVKVADVFALVREDAVAALEDIFVNADKATVEVVTPEAKYETTYVRGENSDVNNLVDELYAKLCEELSEGAAIRELEGTSVYATVDFDFSGKTYTKAYVVNFKRTMAAIDADVDARINEQLVKENEFASIEYISGENHAVVSIKDYSATLADALSAVNEVEALMNIITSESYAETAIVGEEEFVNLYYGDQISASDVLYAVKPEWKDAEDILSKRLAELVGTETSIVVNYKADTTTTFAIYYSIEFALDVDTVTANINEVIAENVATIDAVEVTDESIVLDAAFAVTTDSSVVTIVVNEANTTEEDYIENLQGTGLYTMLESIMAEAKANCGVVANITVGETTVAVDLTSEINSDLVVKAMSDLGVDLIAELVAAPIEITIQFVTGEELEYVVAFVTDDLEGRTEWNAIFLEVYEIPGSTEITAVAGEVTYFQGYGIGGTIMTIEDVENAVVTVQGTEYEAVDGVVEILLPTVMGKQPLVFGIVNNNAVDVTYEVSFEYPLGSQMNPDELYWLSDVEAEFTGSVRANDYMGYFYSYVAENDGHLSLSLKDVTAGVVGDITVTNLNTYETLSVSYDGVEGVVTMPVSKGDELQIQVVALPDKDYNYPAMDFTLVAVYALPEFLDYFDIPGSIEIAVPAGETVFYQSYMIGGTEMTIATDNAVVLYAGTRYQAEEGVIEVALQQGMGRQPVAFGIKNNTDENRVYEVEFAYPVGTQMNPAELAVDVIYAAYNDGRVDGGESYYYTYTAEEDGTVDFWFAECTEGVEGDIIVTNMNTYAQLTLSYDGVADAWGDLSLSVPVAAGDELQIMVVALPDEEWNYPAMGYSVAAVFNYPLGTELNPITLEVSEIPCTLPLTVEAGETVYYQGAGLGGVEVVITNAINGTVLHNGAEYPADFDTIELTFATPMFPMMPVNFAIHNGSTVKTIYQVSFAYPEGSMNNPEEIETGVNFATLPEGNECYYYQWTATEDGAVLFEMSDGPVGWQYAVNNETQYVYGDTHWSDDEEVVSSELVEVKAGDVVVMKVGTYDGSWTNPAGTVSFTLSFLDVAAANAYVIDTEVDVVIESLVREANMNITSDTAVKVVTYTDPLTMPLSNEITARVSVADLDASIDTLKGSAYIEILKAVLTESKSHGAKAIDFYCNAPLADGTTTPKTSSVSLSKSITETTVINGLKALGFKTIGDLCEADMLRINTSYGTELYNRIGYALYFNAI